MIFVWDFDQSYEEGDELDEGVEHDDLESHVHEFHAREPFATVKKIKENKITIKSQFSLFEYVYALIIKKTSCKLKIKFIQHYVR
jgi:hypothetical protein